MNWKHAGILVILAFLLAGALVGCAAGAGGPGRIELSATEFDFGTIPSTNAVSQVFQVHNAGSGPLEIESVSTSCGCTTASIDDRQLAPDETTDLTVTYDPFAHNGATGEFMRIVYLRSSDPGTPEANLTIRVTVVEP